MSAQPFILCPCCGTTIEIEARIVQGELPLGPIPLTEKKLDRPKSEFVKSHDRPTDHPIENSSLNKRDRQRSADRSETVASCEEDLIRSLQEILGEREWLLNANDWRDRILQFRHAILYAIEDWKLRTPEQRRAIKNRGAWVTDRYKRAGGQITKTRKSA